MHKIFDPVTERLKEKEDLDIVTIVVYTDRGLCGPCNNGINRMLDKETLENQAVVVWGEKGCAGFEKSKHKSKVLMSAHPNLKSPLSFLEITQLVSKVMAQVIKPVLTTCSLLISNFLF
jgi:F0F1-type ATP synthase gamma subunit